MTSHETVHFVFERAEALPVRDLAAASERLEAVFRAIESLELADGVPLPIQVVLEEAPLAEPLESSRGVDVIEGPALGLTGYYDTTLRIEWLERDLVKLLVGARMGSHAADTAFIIDGLAGWVALRAEEAELRRVTAALRARLEVGEEIAISTLLTGPAADRVAYHQIATGFVSWLLARYGAASLRAFLEDLDPKHPDRAAEAAYGRPLPVLQEAFLGAVRKPDPALLGVGAFLSRVVRWARPYPLATAGIVGGVLIAVAFEAVLPYSTRFVIDGVVTPKDTSALVIILGVLGGLFLVQLAVGIVRERLAAYVASRMAASLRVATFAHLQRLPMRYYARAQLGDVVSRMTADAGMVEYALTEFLRSALPLPLGLLVNGTLLFLLEWRLALIVLITLPVYVLGVRYINPKAARAQFERQQMVGRVAAQLSENFLAQPVIKAFGLERDAEEKFETEANALLQQNLRVVFLGSLASLTIDGPVALVRVLALGLAAWFVVRGDLTLGGMVAFLALLGTVVSPLKLLAGNLRLLERAAGGLQRVDELLREPAPIRDAPEARALPRLSESLDVSDVTFSYTGEQTNVAGMNLKIPAGKSVAFVGPSGCGKSTILNLVLRFYDPSAGTIRVDGVPLREGTLASLRAQSAVVLQETFLFNTTVKENLRVARPDATDEMLEEAARAAEVHKDIMALPKGYDTPVGERGGRLSGGQKQRLAIARALLRDPAILLLDEATSALDAESEAALNGTLRKVSKGRTVLAVTHRLAWTEEADWIFVLEKGRLVEEGAPKELLARKGAFYKLWRNQQGFIVGEGGEITGLAPEKLDEIPLFAAATLDGATKEALAAKFRIQRCAAGEVVFSEGEAGDEFYVVARGALVVEATLPTGDTRRLATLHDGDHFGEIALLSASPRTATIRATAATELFVLEGSAFQDLLTQPGLREAVERATAARRRANGGE